MRVYTKKRESDFMYEDDMNMILGYLNSHGTLCVSAETVERLYKKFSDECYSAGWMGVNEQILEEFSYWLDFILLR